MSSLLWLVLGLLVLVLVIAVEEWLYQRRWRKRMDAWVDGWARESERVLGRRPR